MKRLSNDIISKINRVLVIFTIFLVISCSSTKLITSWKNPGYDIFKPKKILVIGVTSNYDVRKAYEFQLITELNKREIMALQSAVVFEKSFIDSEQTENDIENQVDKLLSNSYDTVLVSLVKGIDNNESYATDSPKTDYHLRKFIGYYLAYQDAYFKQDYFNNYKVYNIETSIYELKKDSDNTLVWRATFDLIDPENNSKAISSYIKKLVKVLEKNNFISK
ncbi:hypothetical protein [Hyunsoonleella aestuarii]|uniref:hypothetical protein n=1 Tax=Hyunsoonleella aestuarii TaxID=912802 RepID=UPI00111114AF|nr:hypothetical protein [Hyunsoonleella aestuarii]